MTAETSPPAISRRRASFAGWEQLLGLDGSAPPQFEENVGTDNHAVLYLRVSTQRQMNTAIDIDADGNSIATQRQLCVARAKRSKAPIAREFVEPGNSAQTIAKRPVFREMLSYIEEHPEISYVIIYMRSRIFRNQTDAAITKRILANMGVKLLSAKEDFGDGYMGDAMETILDVFNEMQVRQSGEDIKQKLLHKAQNGGTTGRAKLGYLNDRKDFDGRLANTISIDPERAPLVTWAFETYARGNHSVWQLAHSLDLRGLTTRPSHQRPARPVSPSALARILRDPYYTGIVRFKGVEYEGRHPALVSNETFEACQAILDQRNRKGDRDFVHFHYLKGLLYCGRCKAEGRDRRLVYSQNTGNGGTYEYWVCSGKQRDQCTLGTLRMDEVEREVQEAVSRERFHPGDLERFRHVLDDSLIRIQASDAEMKSSLRVQLKQLEGREERLIELAADGGMDTTKVRAKLNAIAAKTRSIREQLTRTRDRLEQGTARALEHLELLEDPGRFYGSASDTTRRGILDALFTRLEVTIDSTERLNLDPQRTEVHGAIHAASAHIASKTRTAPRTSAEGSFSRTYEDSSSSKGLNILELVGMTGFEPATP